MKERPILMSAPMVRAILEGRKTQTRRILKHQPPDDSYRLYRNVCATDRKIANKTHWLKEGAIPGSVADGKQPYFTRPFQPGMRLWVKEAISKPFHLDAEAKKFTGFYKESDPDRRVTWVSPIFMPRWASRITLEITEVRVERLKGISEADAKAEGCQPLTLADGGWVPLSGTDWIGGYRRLWQEINGPGSWDLNPWVFAVSFRRIEGGPQ